MGTNIDIKIIISFLKVFAPVSVPTKDRLSNSLVRRSGGSVKAHKHRRYRRQCREDDKRDDIAVGLIMYPAGKNRGDEGCRCANGIGTPYNGPKGFPTEITAEGKEK